VRDHHANTEEAQRLYLGSLLADSEQGEDAYVRLTDLFGKHERATYQGILELKDAGKPVSAETVILHLGVMSGHTAYISELRGGLREARYYADIIRNDALRRELSKRLEEGVELLEDPNVPASAVAELAAGISMGATDEPVPAQFSDGALAMRFSRQSAADWRYVAQFDKWFRWSGTRWIEDSKRKIFTDIRKVCHEASLECPDKSYARKLGSAPTVANVVRSASWDARHTASAEQWDSEPMLLNAVNGVVDLRSGELREHRREDYFIKIAGVGISDDDCPLWREFLLRVAASDQQLVDFLQRIYGYALTGLTTEQIFLFLYGLGANGKSVFLNTLMYVLGDYATSAHTSTFTVSRNEAHPTELARLQGARLVTAIETSDGRVWDEAKLKSITGGDKICARYMRQDFFEFHPQFKLVVCGNNKPSLKVVDEAIRRRLLLVPFTVTIPPEERDPRLTEKLRAEGPAILRWLVDGCLKWQREGLNPPAVVRLATDEYLNSQDVVSRWITERCVTGSRYWTASSTLYDDWKEWSESTQERPMSQRKLSEALEARGFESTRQGGRGDRARGFTGIGLLVDAVDTSTAYDRTRNSPIRPIREVASTESTAPEKAVQ
jgi:putative DNA primase/helicase